MPQCVKPILAARRRAIMVRPVPQKTTNLLEIENIETCYGRSQVLFGVSLAIAAGEMVSLLGRNGMGKTTTVRSIMGLTPASAGVIRFAGADIRRLPSYRVARYGIGSCLKAARYF